MTTTNINNKDMHIVALRSNLVKGVDIVECSVGSSGSSLPILSFVLLKANESSLTLTTTNLETVIEYSLQCKVMSSGSLCVPFSVFRDIVRNLNSERVTLMEKDGSLQIISDGYEALLKGQSIDDFPIVPSVERTDISLTFSSGVFREFLASVSGSARHSDIRPEISGVYLATKEGVVNFVATDSFRLAERVMSGGSFTIPDNDVSCIIPIQTVGDLLRVLPQDDTPLTVVCDTHQIVIITDSCRVISRIVEGKFPDYSQIIPSSFSNEIRLDRDEFIDAVQSARSFSGKGSDITISSDGKSKCIEICSSDGALGEGVYRVSAQVSGGAVSIVLNWKYVLDGLKVYSGKDVSLGINEPDKPVRITSDSPSGMLYLVMPIKG